MSQDEWSQDKAEFVARPANAPHPAGDPDRSPLARQFAQLTQVLLDADSVAGVLQHVADAAAAVLPNVELVSVTLRSSDGALHTPVETDQLGAELDEWQYQFNEGPCLEAARTPGLAYTYSGDLSSEPKWPRFGPKAADLGFRSVLSTAMLPDITPPRLSGALNLYSRAEGKLGDEMTRDQALLLATHASLAVANTEAVRLAELEQLHLRRALETRDIIGQAKGILMQRRGISADEAFELLRRASQDLNIKLAEVAHTVATRYTELGPPNG